MLLEAHFTKLFITFLLCTIPLLSFSSQFAKAKMTDAQVKEMLIQQSIASYRGSCACPYQRDKIGRLCGKRSAWSRPAGYKPLCYPSDVAPRMIEGYRRDKRC